MSAPSGTPHIYLSDLIVIIRQRWLLGLSIGLLMTTVFMTYFMSRTPLYEGIAKMVVEFNPDQIVNVQEVVDSRVNNSNFFQSVMNTHIVRMSGRTMASEVVQNLSPQQQLALGVLQNSEDESERMIDYARFISKSALTIEWLPDSQVLSIHYRHPNPDTAQAIANAYVQTYISLQLNTRSLSTGKAVTFLDEQTLELRQQLDAKEKELHEYREEHKLINVEQEREVLADKINKVNKAITEAQLQQVSLETKLEQIDNCDGNVDKLMTIPSIGNVESIQKTFLELRGFKRDKTVLNKRYLERHPKQLELDASISSTLDTLSQAIAYAVDELKVQLQAVQNELAKLDEKLADTESSALRLEALFIDYQKIEQAVESQRNTFNLVSNRLNETSLAQQMKLTSIRILDLSARPKNPVYPNPLKVSLAGIALFCVIFAGLPIGLELLDNRLKTFQDIERFVGKPVLGDIRLHKELPDSEMTQLARSDDYQLSEPFDSLYGAIRLQLGQLEPPLSFVVTSSIPSEGKSIIAANLSAALSEQQFKVCLIDCDLRRPSLHRYLDRTNTKGLINWVRSNAPLHDNPLEDLELGIQQLSPDSEVYLLSSGGSTKQSSSIIEDKRFDLLVSKLKQHFDILIFDTPPVGLFHDAALVADYADHTLFVARQHATTRQKTRHSVTQMERSEAPVLGLVFNGVKDQNLASGYGYKSGDYNYSSYSDRYSYGTSNAAEKYHKAYAVDKT